MQDSGRTNRYAEVKPDSQGNDLKRDWHARAACSVFSEEIVRSVRIDRMVEGNLRKRRHCGAAWLAVGLLRIIITLALCHDRVQYKLRRQSG